MAAPSRERLPAGTIRLGTIAGCDVRLSSSWFLVAALIAVVMAPRVEQVQPGLGLGTYVVGLVFAILLYGAVLLHELSHAVVARRLGFPVRSITLHFLGGMTAVGAEARTPRQEFLVAVVGPLTSLAVGGAALVLWLLVPADQGLVLLALEGLAGANLLIGVLNLVPGLPLDGGRVLKAAVWQLSGQVHVGVLAAGWGGRVTAVLALLWPFGQLALLGVEPTIVDYLVSVVIAVFLWAGAGAAMNAARMQRRIPQVVARDLARRALAVPGDMPLAEAVRRARESGAGGIVTLAGDRPSGVVNESALGAVPEERRPWVPTSSVARTLEQGLSLPVGITGDQLVHAIRALPAAEYVLVEDDGTVYGVLSTVDVDRVVRG